MPLLLQRQLFPFESLSIKEERLLVRTSTADTWNRLAVSLVSFNSTSKGILILSLLVIPSFNNPSRGGVRVHGEDSDFTYLSHQVSPRG